MKVKLGKKSKLNLSVGLDYRLVHLAIEVAKIDCPCDWGVYETKRTLETQKKYVAQGTSKTMKSNHLENSKGIVNAMDIVPYIANKYLWDENTYRKLIPLFKEIANKLYPGEIEFGYDWGWDMPHIEIKKEFQL